MLIRRKTVDDFFCESIGEFFTACLRTQVLQRRHCILLAHRSVLARRRVCDSPAWVAALSPLQRARTSDISRCDEKDGGGRRQSVLQTHPPRSSLQTYEISRECIDILVAAFRLEDRMARSITRARAGRRSGRTCGERSARLARGPGEPLESFGQVPDTNR